VGLFFGQLIDLDAHREKLDPGDLLVNLERNGIDFFLQGSMMLHQVLRGKRLVGKLISMTLEDALCGGEVDQPSFPNR